MSELDRREFMKSATMMATTIAASGLMANQAIADSKKEEKVNHSIHEAFSNEITVKPLTFDPKKLKGISEKLITSHWENNYGGSVTTLNSLNKKLSELINDKEAPPYIYNGLKREHLLRTGSVVLHEIYFENLGGNGQISGDVHKDLVKEFGDIDIWEREFRRIGQGLSGGSGWVILGFNTHLSKLENYWSWDHMHSPASTIPLLVMDMYEHSYQMDYGAAAAKYIDAFFQNIQWEAVEKRFQTCKKFMSLI